MKYVGIGSRTTPPEIMEKFKQVSAYLYKLGFTLRSGAAPGADTAFDEGYEGEDKKEIFLPWMMAEKN